MIIRIARRPRGFTQIDNRTLRDPSISLKAKGVLAWVLSYPDDWTGSLEELVAEGPDGRDAIRAAIRELESVGYITRRKLRGGDGRWRTELEVFELPGVVGKPDTTEAGLSVVVETGAENAVTSDNAEESQVTAGTALPASENQASGTNTKPTAKTVEYEEPPAPPKKPRARDLIFDAIATVCQIGEHPTKSEASMIGKAKREILATFPPAGDGLGIHDIGPEDVAEEIIVRGREAWRRWGGQPFTPAALTKHWSSLAVPAPARNGNGRGKKYDVTDAWNEIEEMMSHGAQRVENDQRAALRGVPGGERDAG